MKFWPLLLLVVITSARAQLANQPPQPQWLSGAGAFEKPFTQEGKLLKAILFGAGELEVTVNGQAAGQIHGAQQAASLDVTRFIHEGANQLRLDSASGRIAALLELNGDLARKTWIKTDESWASTRSPLKAEAIAPAENPFDFKKTFDSYNSWQLARPGAQSTATDPATFTLLPGFKAELIRSSQPGEDSWVSMTFDPQGRIILGREKRGLLRFDPRTAQTELIEDTLLECRGLLFVDGVLFANANNSKGLYRLQDKDGDGRFEDMRELVHTEGGVGHGRNHIKLGPDGYVYIAHGNNVLLPTNVSDRSPMKRYANDQLLPNPWDGTMFDGNVELPAGHVLRVKPDGSDLQLVAGGLRNPLDLAFNHDGDLFTFDADMERDVGASWYMPTRVLHVVPGADFGWRRGTGRYPSWYPEMLPSVIDIGLSSPTGVFFGYGAKFPAKYQDALFIFDWSYGRIIAVHMKTRGASYRGEQETFVSGRPLNVTDGCIGPDGALWFTTGGRGTQSGLYRIVSEHPDPVASRSIAMPAARHADESSDDAFERQAAVLEMEARAGDMPVEQIGKAASGWTAISRWLVAVRSDRNDLRTAAVAAATRFAWDTASEEQRLAVLRILAIGLSRGAQPSGNLASWLESKWTGKPSPRSWELTKLLVYLKSPSIIAKATDLLKSATASEDLLFYPMHLRYLKEGWTLDQRHIVFEALNRAETMNGASSYFKAIADARAELASALSPEGAAKLASVISPPKPAALSPHALPTHTFKQWKLADLEPMLAKVASGRSFEGAKTALVSVQCVFCHRVTADNSLPAGIVGPDLAQVSARFGRRDLLMHILEPSAVIDEKFRSVLITQVDGKQVSGSLEQEDDERVILKPNPLAKDVIEIAKAQIKERRVSDISTMPPGLLNALKADQILDLLAWFESSGNPQAKNWQSAAKAIK